MRVVEIFGSDAGAILEIEKMNEFRDPIHGFITPTDLEVKIINTSVFQRLRKIKQLAMAYLVYPSANHTRFEHSLGVYHIASLMADKFLPGKEKESEDKRRIIRLAALLHDVGHGPFSHVSEGILDKYSNISDNISNQEEVHEKIAVALINNNKELKDLLYSTDRKEITGLLSGENVDIPLMKEIVSGPVDADKMDYLLRDSYFCGVKYGIFDLERMLNTLNWYEDDSGKHIGINYDGINSLEQYVLAKYYIARQVYYHKVRSLTDAMITRGIELGIDEDNLTFLKEVYSYDVTEKYLDNYLECWDDRIIDQLIYEENGGLASDIFKRLYTRNLFKRIFSYKIKDLEIEVLTTDKLININKKENLDLRKDIEQQIADLISCKKEYVIVNSFTVKFMKKKSEGLEGKIMVIDEKENKKVFEEESTIFSSIREAMKDMYFEVYAPLEYENRQSKHKKLSELEKEIIKILKETVMSKVL